MSSLLKIEVTPRGSLTGREAAEYVGGPAALRVLEELWGLRPWDTNPTNRRYRVTAIEEAMKRAESSQTQSTAAE
jgi:hypothetical protein